MERKKRKFWVVGPESDRVREAIGEETQYSDVWWFPTIGYSLTGGVQAFDDEKSAKDALRAKLNKRIAEAREALRQID